MSRHRWQPSPCQSSRGLTLAACALRGAALALAAAFVACASGTAPSIEVVPSTRPAGWDSGTIESAPAPSAAAPANDAAGAGGGARGNANTSEAAF